MSALALVLVAEGLIAGSGILALVLARTPRAATAAAALGAVAGGIVGLCAVAVVLQTGVTEAIVVPWAVPGGELAVGIDPLSAFFLAPLFVLGALCAVYGRGYLGCRVVPASELNLLLATMMLVLIARHALLFLVAWEVMTLLAYLLVTFEHDEAEVRRAGWVYLIAAHSRRVALLALFVAARSRAPGRSRLRRRSPRGATPGAGARRSSCSRWRWSASASRPGIVAAARAGCPRPRRGAVARLGADVGGAHQARAVRHPAHDAAGAPSARGSA